jgi:hypothetical protein
MMKTISPNNTHFPLPLLKKIRNTCRRLTSRDSLDTTLLIIAVGVGLIMTVGFAIPALRDVNNQPPAAGPTDNTQVRAIFADNPQVIENPVR